MKYIINHAGQPVSYQVVRSRRKSISVQVDRDGEVTVRAPLRMPEEQLAGWVNGKMDWIAGKREEILRNLEGTRRSYESGETFFYLGKEYILVNQREGHGNTGHVELSEKEGVIRIFLPGGDGRERGFGTGAGPEEIRRLLLGWYQDRMEDYLSARLPLYLERLGERAAKVRIRDMKSRWGSCSAIGNLSFNWRLIMAPPEIIDYVIVHEVCHLREMNHKKPFWDLVVGILPDYKERRRRLKADQKYFIFN